MKRLSLPFFRSKKVSDEFFLILSQSSYTILQKGDTNGEPLRITGEWNKSTLKDAFTKIALRSKNPRVSLLLSDALVWIRSFPVTTEQEFYEHLSSVIPGELEEQCVEINPLTLVGGTHVHQVIVVKRSLLDLIGAIAGELNLTIAAVNPIAFTIAKQFTQLDSDDAVAVMWNQDIKNLALIAQGKVLAVSSFTKADIYKETSSLLSFGQELLSVQTKLLIMPKDDAKEVKDKLPEQTIKEEDVSPVESVANEEFVVQDAPKKSPKELFKEAESLESTKKPEPVTEQASETPDENSENSGIMEDTNLAAPTPPLKVIQKPSTMQPTPEFESKSKSNTKLILIIVTILVILIGIVVGGLLVYQNAVSQQQQTDVIEADPTPIPTPLPQQTEDPMATDSAEPTDEGEETSEIDPSELSIQVLNGSGVPGAAGAVEELLTAEEIESVATGNADSYDYEETEIRVKAGNRALYEYLLGIIEDDYSVIRGDDLPATSNYDAVIVVGQS